MEKFDVGGGPSARTFTSLVTTAILTSFSLFWVHYDVIVEGHFPLRPKVGSSQLDSVHMFEKCSHVTTGAFDKLRSEKASSLLHFYFRLKKLSSLFSFTKTYYF